MIAGDGRSVPSRLETGKSLAEMLREEKDS
jgi:hypothetical protein